MSDHSVAIDEHETARFERLDAAAVRLIKADEEGLCALSTSETLYVAFAASRHDLIKEEGYSLIGAMNRLGDEWLHVLRKRWRDR